ncbi:MAG TPA: hypothetical protein DEV93_22080 [Chloroflexi bacterium]|jgi:excisionase family DNA binding protein|nr:hypothetical protein [Chloroflexota bacterium]
MTEHVNEIGVVGKQILFTEPSLYETNAHVHHETFGNGVVIESSLKPDGTPYVMVAFDDDETPFRDVVASPMFLSLGWDEDEAGKRVSPTARSLKRELFGSDLTADDVSYILDLDRATILRYLREGRVVGYQVGREWRIPGASLKDYKSQMMAEKQRDAARLAKTAELEERLALLRQNYPDIEANWRISVCTKCQEPLLLEWNEHGFYADCPACQAANFYAPAEKEEADDMDTMPF